MITTELEWNGAQVQSAFEAAQLRSLTEAAILIRGKAVLLAPVDQGNLRNSITYVISGSAEDFPDAVASGDKTRNRRGELVQVFTLTPGQTITAAPGEAIIGTVVFYGPYIEFGTRFMRAQPFLLPAYRDSIPAILSFFRRNYRGVRFVI
jgi:HK97 gp10 family phage protein